jgi:hypothetical protein
MRTTKEVWEHHCIAFANANIDEVISDFAEDAIYVTANNVIKGKENIRKIYDNHFKTAEEGSTSKIISQTLEGEIVIFEWTSDTPSIYIPDGVDTFVIRDGFIVAQTMRGTVINKEKNIK